MPNTNQITIQQFTAGPLHTLNADASGVATWLSYTLNGQVYNFTFPGRPLQADLERIQTLNQRFSIEIEIRLVETHEEETLSTQLGDPLKLYTTQQVAELLGVSYETVISWNQKGLITPSFDNKNVKAYTQADIDARKAPAPAHRPRKKKEEA